MPSSLTPPTIPEARAGNAQVPADEELTKFVSAHANFYSHFKLKRGLIDRQTYKTRRSAALAEWQLLMACGLHTAAHLIGREFATVADHLLRASDGSRDIS